MKIEEIITQLCSAAINSVMPGNFIPASVSRTGNILDIRGKKYDLDQYAHIYIVSVGKAACGMAEALDHIIFPYGTAGIVLTKHLPENRKLRDIYRVMQGGHPIPSEGSIAGAEAILAMLDKARADDLVIYLISGGGSALMTKPVAGIDPETFRAFSNDILCCGASINEFNTLRKHLDEVKGGRLAQHAAPAQQITVVLSDVVGSPLEVIASGPTVPDPTTYQDALDILDRYSERRHFPEAIRNVLELGAAGKIPETLKTDDLNFAKTDVFLLAENRTAAHAAAQEGEKLGFASQVINTQLTGEAAVVGALLPSFFSEMKERSLLVFGGETTVQIHGNGTGGRNQELALASVRQMAERPGCVLVALATDGEDGPTDAAGAYVTSETLSQALEICCDPDVYLRNNDSYRFFQKTGSLIQTGSSGTNVNDLTFLLRM